MLDRFSKTQCLPITCCIEPLQLCFALIIPHNLAQICLFHPIFPYLATCFSAFPRLISSQPSDTHTNSHSLQGLLPEMYPLPSHLEGLESAPVCGSFSTGSGGKMIAVALPTRPPTPGVFTGPSVLPGSVKEHSLSGLRFWQASPSHH